MVLSRSYFFHDRSRPLYLLMVYAKGRKDDLDADDKKALRALAAEIKGKRRKELAEKGKVR